MLARTREDGCPITDVGHDGLGMDPRRRPAGMTEWEEDGDDDCRVGWSGKGIGMSDELRKIGVVGIYFE